MAESESNQIKNQVQSRFGEFAQGYIESKSHATGTDLERLVELAQPKPNWLMLDIATGGGHTALRFAPHVCHVIASDLTHKMLLRARKHIHTIGTSNISFSGADAENLPFPDETFDLVTCRIAPHHFPDTYCFIQECARIVKSGGQVLIQDHLLPDNKQAATYVDAIEKLRDPSHVRGIARYEWCNMFENAELTIEHIDNVIKRRELIPWAERQGNTPDIIERLQIMLIQAPRKVSEWILPEHAGTARASFVGHHIIIAGRKA